MSITDKEIIIFDTEVKPNRFLFRARSKKTGHKVALWHHIPGDMDKLRRLLRNDSLLWVGFNSKNFDWPLVTKACSGAGPTEIYNLAQDIIENRKPAWMTYRDAGLETPDVDTIDLMEVAPGVLISLKLYGARLGMKAIVDSPFHHSELLDDWQLDTELTYCDNDIDTTDALFESQREALLLREKLGAKHGIDLRSKSDAQLAEAIIAKKLGLWNKAGGNVPQSVRYKAPDFIQPQSAILRDILLRVKQHKFAVKQSNGAVELPDFLAKETVHIGTGVYQMGIGGLHSKHDRSQWWVRTDELIIEDWDVEAFYPNILLEAGFVPAGLGQPFIDLYRSFLEDRVSAKHRVAEIKARLKEIDAELAADGK